MYAAESNISGAEKEKDVLVRKIDKFILDVYGLNLMNESVVFLRNLKASDVTISSETEKKLFCRLFLIENAYRKQFEKFEEIVKSDGEVYKVSNFEQTDKSLKYTAERIVKVKKFKGKIFVSLYSQASSVATLNFTGKNDFIISKNKLENAEERIRPVLKNYTLKVDRSNFSAELNKIFENNELVPEVEKLGTTLNEYAKECEAILNTMSENGASSNVFSIFFGKIGNKIAHNKKKREAYKLMSPEDRKAAKAAEKQAKQEAKAAKKSGNAGGKSFKEKFQGIRNKNLITIGILICMMLIAFILLKFLN